MYPNYQNTKLPAAFTAYKYEQFHPSSQEIDFKI